MRIAFQEKIFLERALVFLGAFSIIGVASITIFEVLSGHDGTLAVAAFTSINTIVNLTVVRALVRTSSKKRKRNAG